MYVCMYVCVYIYIYAMYTHTNNTVMAGVEGGYFDKLNNNTCLEIIII